MVSTYWKNRREKELVELIEEEEKKKEQKIKTNKKTKNVK
jgi:hypothetical protein